MTNLVLLCCNKSKWERLQDSVVLKNLDDCTDPLYKKYYLEKVDFLKNASVIFTISEDIKRNVSTSLNFPENSIFNISSSFSFFDQKIPSKYNKLLKTIEKSKPKETKKISWDEDADKVIRKLEEFHENHAKNKNLTLALTREKRLKLAYISPIPPEHTGIADYSAELIPELAKIYDIKIITDQNVSDSLIDKDYKIHNIKWFKKNSDSFDRILYHFGNSSFHKHMFELLEIIPGVVVLHDFFLSSIVSHLESNGRFSNNLAIKLYESHGYKAVFENFRINNLDKIIQKYPCNLEVLQKAIGIISHSKYAKTLVEKWYKTSKKNNLNWDIIPLLITSTDNLDNKKIRKELNFNESDFIVSSFGTINPLKLNHRLLETWINSELSSNPTCVLVFIGEIDKYSSYGKQLLDFVDGKKHYRIYFTGRVDQKTFRKYLSISDLAVQLRKSSQGETSREILDCMNYGIPTIINANGSMNEIPDDAVFKIPDKFENNELKEALEKLLKNERMRDQISKKAKEVILEKHDPKTCAEQYSKTIEKFYENEKCNAFSLIKKIAPIARDFPNDNLKSIASDINQNLPLNYTKKQIFIDISAIIETDLKTGIQRAVKAILKELLLNPPKDFRIEPVYTTPTNSTYYYARHFTCKFLEIDDSWGTDSPIEFQNEDVFLGLDFVPNISNNIPYLEQLYNFGVHIYFVIYDILPITFPNFFPDFMNPSFQNWLKAISRFDGVLCISHSVCDSFKNWLETTKIKRFRPLKTNWFHIGADLKSSVYSKGLPEDALQTLSMISKNPSFLMVGTLEPRKGHAEVLNAFDILWKQKKHLNLIIVGKEGWMVQSLIDRIKNHKEINKHLFWLGAISDEYLEKVYKNSTCLIAASEGEGFGLPLIEAAFYRIPIIARDIPVFREVAKENAYYFENSKEKYAITKTIENWIGLYKNNDHPKSWNMTYLTWKESAKQLLDIILDQN